MEPEHSAITFHFHEGKENESTPLHPPPSDIELPGNGPRLSVDAVTTPPPGPTISSGFTAPPPKRRGDEGPPPDLTEEEKEFTQFLSFERICEKFATHVDAEDPRRSRGLTEEAAEKKLRENGPNILTPPAETPEILKYLHHYLDPFMLLLTAAGVLSVIAWAIDKKAAGAQMNWIIGCVLFAVVFVSSTFGYIQEGKASDAMKSFKSMLPQYCHVIRDGQLKDMPAANLVVGDLVKIKTGDKCPADLRIVYSGNCKCDLSSLTGESVPITLTSTTSERKREEAKNLAWNTSQIVEGEAFGVVVSTGDRTLIGEIKELTAGEVSTLTPIQVEIQRFVRALTIFSVVLGAIFFGIGVGTGSSVGTAFVNGFIVVMIANVPEGLPMTVVSCLTITARKMAELNVFIKELRSVETLGSATCICTDKTGTLTKNLMSVSHLWYDTLPEGGVSANSVLTDTPPQILNTVPTKIGVNTTLHLMELVAAICCQVRFIDNKNLTDDEAASYETYSALKNAVSNNALTMRSARSAFPFLGKMDPTMTMRSAMNALQKPPDDSTRKREGGDASETALFNFVSARQSTELMRYHYPIVHDVPFNSRVKYACTIVKPHNIMRTNHRRLLFMKGAPEIVIGRCSHYLDRGQKKEMDENYMAEFQDNYEIFASYGERVIGFAYLELDEKNFGPDKDAQYKDGLEFPTSGLTFLGIISLIDPPKESVPAAIAQCRSAGVKVIMVTGDHPLTAASIARSVGILSRPTRDLLALERHCREDEIPEEDVQAIVQTGADIERIKDNQAEWDRILTKHEIVFARTTPAQKLAIVENCQRLGNIVAVTGDGVNDSPALKKADIGVAMGISGSDVARDAADVILIKDDFASIVDGIRAGRTIFDNLSKTIAYTLTHMVPEVMPVLVALCGGFPLSMSAIQILFIDLATEMAPAISLAYEPAESDVMNRKPRNAKTDRLVSSQMIFYCWFQAGGIETLVCFLGFFLVFNYEGIPSYSLVGAATSKETHFASDNNADFTAVGKTYSNDAQVRILGEAQSVYWLLLTAGQAGHIWLCKTRTLSLFQHGIFNNHMMISGVIIQWCLIIIILYLPWTQSFFGTHTFPGQFWALLFVVWTALFLLHEVRKAWVRTYPKGAVDKVLSW